MNLEALRTRFLADGYCRIEDVIPAERVGEIGENVARDVRAHSWLERPTGDSLASFALASRWTSLRSPSRDWCNCSSDHTSGSPC